MGTPRIWFDFLSRRPSPDQGVNDAWILRHESVAKCNSTESPYLVANEWVCGRIATFLGLPVPPFALVRHGAKGKRLFATLRFGGIDAIPDDTDPAALYAKHPNLCAGILLFDILVANGDRHRGNLKVDAPQNPRQVWLFDHDRALLGHRKGEASRRLDRLQTQLGLCDSTTIGQNSHCLLDVIDTTEHFTPWLDRIHRLPSWFVDEACRYVLGLGMQKRLIKKVVAFINYRRKNLLGIIQDNKPAFSRISRWEPLL